MGKTHRKHHPQSARSRTTRSHKPRLLADPSESSANLDAQLRALGLYPANTIGDGNCLFRALSDQLYGSPSKHPFLRQAICDFIVANKARYEPFCEDERGLDVHIKCMRENGTYGGHLELSSFAHMVKRNVKVVQPGLVYVIEWGAGMDEAEKERELSRRRKEEEKEGLEMCKGTLYVAYHDWEHFSSIRNLNGPHVGLPNVVEAPAVVGDSAEGMDAEKRDPKKEREKARKEKEKARKITKVKLKLSAPPSAASTPPPSSATMLVDPEPSVAPSPSAQPLQAASATALAPPAFRVHRSPKRTFDESTSSEDGQSVVSDDVERGRGQDKRSRISALPTTTIDPSPLSISAASREETPATDASEGDDEGGDDSESGEENEAEEEAEVAAAVAALSPSPAPPPSSTSTSTTTPAPVNEPVDDGYSSLSSLSELSDSDAAPAPTKKQQKTKQVHLGEDGKALTRRQRKALGLPKHRGLLQKSHSQSPGKIVIPGGRFKGRVSAASAVAGAGEVQGEWVKSGVGRMDVRGFRELKI